MMAPARAAGQEGRRCCAQLLLLVGDGRGTTGAL